MMPHEQLLVRRLQNQPFALLGITTDRDRMEAAGFLHQRGYTWRNWWDHTSAIIERWEVNALPTIVLVDARGVVRFSQVGFLEGEVIDREVDRLLAEAGAGGT